MNIFFIFQSRNKCNLKDKKTKTIVYDELMLFHWKSELRIYYSSPYTPSGLNRLKIGLSWRRKWPLVEEPRPYLARTTAATTLQCTADDFPSASLCLASSPTWKIDLEVTSIRTDPPDGPPQLPSVLSHFISGIREDQRNRSSPFINHLFTSLKLYNNNNNHSLLSKADPFISRYLAICMRCFNSSI